MCNPESTCKTVELISLYGNKRLKKLCSKPVKYDRKCYCVASKLPSIEEALYYNEVNGDLSRKELHLLNRQYRKTCRELERAIKNATRRYNGYVKMGLLRTKEG